MDRKRFYSNPGNPIQVTYSSKLDRSGNIIVFESGKTNLYEKIQEYANICDINNLVKRFESGDVTALNQRHASYMDLTEMPKDYFEMVNKINDAKNEFMNLPLEIRNKFDNDENKFIAAIGTNDWLEKLSGKKVNQVNVEEHDQVEKVGDSNE